MKVSLGRGGGSQQYHTDRRGCSTQGRKKRPRRSALLLHAGTFLSFSVSVFHCRSVVCACSAGTVGSFSTGRTAAASGRFHQLSSSIRVVISTTPRCIGSLASALGTNIFLRLVIGLGPRIIRRILMHGDASCRHGDHLITTRLDAPRRSPRERLALRGSLLVVSSAPLHAATHIQAQRPRFTCRRPRGHIPQSSAVDVLSNYQSLPFVTTVTHVIEYSRALIKDPLQFCKTRSKPHSPS